MTAYVDIATCSVRCGEHAWHFDVDCRSGGVHIALQGVDYSLLPLGWRQKRNLARFIHLGEDFLRRQFLQVSLPAALARLPDDEEELAVLSALVRWLNAPDGRAGLPLDEALLAAVTLDVCRQLQLAPGAFDELAAADVEMLWQTARAGVAAPLDAPRADPAGAAMTRIMVVPDAQGRDSEAAIANPATASVTGTEPSAAATTATGAGATGSQPAFAVAAIATNPEVAFAGGANALPAKTAASIAPQPYATRAAVVPSPSRPAARFRVNIGAVIPGTALPAAEPPAIEPPAALPAAAATAAPSLAVVRGVRPMQVPAPAVVPAPTVAAIATALSQRDTSALPEPDCAHAPLGGSHGAAPQPQQWLHELADALDLAARAAGIELEG